MVPSTTQTIDGVSYTITLADEWANMMQMVDTGQDPSKANVLTKDTQAVDDQSMNNQSANNQSAGDQSTSS